MRDTIIKQTQINEIESVCQKLHLWANWLDLKVDMISYYLLINKYIMNIFSVNKSDQIWKVKISSEYQTNPNIREAKKPPEGSLLFRKGSDRFQGAGGCVSTNINWFRRGGFWSVTPRLGIIVGLDQV